MGSKTVYMPLCTPGKLIRAVWKQRCPLTRVTFLLPVVRVIRQLSLTATIPILFITHSIVQDIARSITCVVGELLHPIDHIVRTIFLKTPEVLAALAKAEGVANNSTHEKV